MKVPFRHYLKLFLTGMQLLVCWIILWGLLTRSINVSLSVKVSDNVWSTEDSESDPGELADE